MFYATICIAAWMKFPEYQENIAILSSFLHYQSCDRKAGMLKSFVNFIYRVEILVYKKYCLHVQAEKVSHTMIQEVHTYGTM